MLIIKCFILALLALSPSIRLFAQPLGAY
jgi:hypothetical protein